MNKSPTERTKQTYCSEAGARAYIDKEQKNHESRSRQAYTIINDLNLQNLKILDVGCGFGRDVLAFRRRGAKAYGIDISPSLLTCVSDHKDWFRQADILDHAPLPFKDQFDLIWTHSFFVHVPREDMPRILKKLWCTLAEGGLLVITTKIGYGEKMKSNLGAGLERLMVYYQKDEILSALLDLDAVEDRVLDENVGVPTGDTLMTIRVKKT